MAADRFIVKYGHDGSRYRYTHAHAPTLDAAKESADRWKAGGAWGGIPQEELRVWVENKGGEVVYGQAAEREEK